MAHMAVDMSISFKTRTYLRALGARQDGRKTGHEKRRRFITAAAISVSKKASLSMGNIANSTGRCDDEMHLDNQEVQHD